MSIPFVIAGLFAALALLASAGDAASAPRYEIETGPIAPPNITAPAPDLSRYTVDAVRDMIPQRFDGRSAKSLPLNHLYFTHGNNLFELQRVWQQNGTPIPQAIVLSHGSYTLEMVYEQLADPTLLQKENDTTYLLRNPLYIAPNATLVIKDNEWLKLSLNTGVFLFYNGHLIITDAKITTWDEQQLNYGERAEIAESEILMYGLQQPRPYFVGLSGSESYFANSFFHGLGYKGSRGTFGITMSASSGDTPLQKFLRDLPKPTGWLIGNRIENLFFGFYTREAQNAVVVGNDFSDNVIYGIDPHDYSDNLIIARNVVRNSGVAHGIIISRDVTNTWIFDNISYNNSGSGIMLDRNSTQTQVHANLVFNNQGDGIALLESDSNELSANLITRNQRNGIYVRNSSEIDIHDNQLLNNGSNGVEILSLNIDHHITRDFTLDPYRQNASARIHSNDFTSNVNSAIAGKAADSIELFDNRFHDSGPLYFSGDLEPLGTQLIDNLDNRLRLIQATE